MNGSCEERFLPFRKSSKARASTAKRLFWWGSLSAIHSSAKATSTLRRETAQAFQRTSTPVGTQTRSLEICDPHTMLNRRDPPRILILGGTSEASGLAALLSPRRDLQVVSSLAGRLSQPTLPTGMVRIGGFGGIDGLMAYLAQQNIAA